MQNAGGTFPLGVFPSQEGNPPNMGRSSRTSGYMLAIPNATLSMCVTPRHFSSARSWARSWEPTRTPSVATPTVRSEGKSMGSGQKPYPFSPVDSR